MKKITRFGLAKVCIAIIFLALTRSIMEPIRLNYVSENAPQYSEIFPFLYSAMIDAIGLIVAFLFYNYKKYGLTIATTILIVAMMLVIKSVYL